MAELGRLWASPYVPGAADEAMMEYARNLGWERMGAVYDAVHPLPWSVLRPLAALPAWAIYPGGVSAPLTERPSESEQRIRQLPDDLARWRRLNRTLNHAGGIFHGIFQRHCDDVEPREPDHFLCALSDALDIAHTTTRERLYYLEEWAAGTRPGRLTGEGKSDGKAQNLARLRAVAVGLALHINRAIPLRRRDGRVLHGVLRACVRRRMVAIISTVYGITFSEAEAKDMLHKHVKERSKASK